MNDPNAPVYWNGEYHMFYQYNPKAPYWDTMHWGHAASRDLVHWQHLPIALAPTPGGPDKDGCFSGCMVIDNGKPVIVYTGVKPEVQCLATTEDMVTFRKHPANPVIAKPPVDTPGFRDPHVWRQGNEWMMALGAGFRGKGGAILLFSSPDLITWKYLHPLLAGTIDNTRNLKDAVDSGEMWECPDFFPLGDKHLLYVSTKGQVLYWLGTYRDLKFTPEKSGVLVHGPYYAPKSCEGASGKRVIWGWLRERRSREAQVKAGWSGVMSIPAIPSLSPTGELQLDPARELAVQRRAEYRLEKPFAVTGDVLPLQGIDLGCCEIGIRLEPGATSTVGIRRGNQTLASYRAGALTVGSETASVPVAQSGVLDLRLFLDGSVIEVFANRRVAMVARLYGLSGGLSLFSEGGASRAHTLDVWEIRPISKDRLTS